VLAAGLGGCQKEPEFELLPGPDCNAVLQTVGENSIDDRGDRHYTDLGLGRFQIGTGEYLLDILNRNGEPPPGFVFYEGHRGGVGDVLLLEGCVFMTYIGGGLNSIAARGFTVTDTGLHWNSTLEEFLQEYPNARKRKMVSYFTQDGELWTSGHFKVNIGKFTHRIRMMEVSSHDYDLDDIEEETYPIGPQYGPHPWQ